MHEAKKCVEKQEHFFPGRERDMSKCDLPDVDDSLSNSSSLYC